MLEFQATEIEKSALAAGEEEALRVEKARQANAGRLAALSGEAYGLLYDDEGAALSRLGQVFRRVEDLAAHRLLRSSPSSRRGRGRSRRSRTWPCGCATTTSSSRSAPGASTRSRPASPSSSASRRSTGRRSRRSWPSASAAAASWTRSLSPEEQERTLEARRERLAAAYLERARALSKRRRAAALDLRKRVQAELAQLAMEKTRFEVRVRPGGRRGRGRLRRSGPSAASSGPSSCSRRTPARSCGRSRGSPRGASSPASCSASSRSCGPTCPG